MARRAQAPSTPQALRAGGAGRFETRILNRTVVIGALGYFVDIYDLLLFSILRVPSLRGLGVPEAELLDTGVLLLNAQMVGLLLGGILWGVLGDRRGRVSVLFGSIALYSLANIANAFVTDVNTYAALRFLAGLGLAGELGAAITLVNEVMSKETRGYGTAVVAGVGILGAVAAGLVGALFDWRVAYLVGGFLGLALLVARAKLRDSGMFHRAQRGDAPRGDLRLLLGSRARLAKFTRSVLVGLPIWFIIGVLITFSPELALGTGVAAPVSAGIAVMVAYAGAALGDFGWGVLSQRLRTRWWVMLGTIGLTAALILVYVFVRGLSLEAFYVLCFLLGVAGGYWAVFNTSASEQFGTNLRATVTTATPNLIRGSTVPITLAFQFLGARAGLPLAALVVGLACVFIALWALRGVEETWGKDLDYVETAEATAPAPAPAAAAG